MDSMFKLDTRLTDVLPPPIGGLLRLIHLLSYYSRECSLASTLLEYKGGVKEHKKPAPSCEEAGEVEF